MIYILLALGFYIGYRLFADIIIPVFRTSKQVHRHFKDMQERMQEQQQASQNAYQQQSSSNKSNSSPVVGDYIDFEEIK